MKYEWYRPAGFLNCNGAIDWFARKPFLYFLAIGKSFWGMQSGWGVIMGAANYQKVKWGLALLLLMDTWIQLPAVGALAPKHGLVDTSAANGPLKQSELYKIRKPIIISITSCYSGVPLFCSYQRSGFSGRDKAAAGLPARAAATHTVR